VEEKCEDEEPPKDEPQEEHVEEKTGKSKKGENKPPKSKTSEGNTKKTGSKPCDDVEKGPETKKARKARNSTVAAAGEDAASSTKVVPACEASTKKPKTTVIANPKVKSTKPSKNQQKPNEQASGSSEVPSTNKRKAKKLEKPKETKDAKGQASDPAAESKRRVSRKSSAYHKAKLAALKAGKSKEQAIAMAKQVVQLVMLAYLFC